MKKLYQFKAPNPSACITTRSIVPPGRLAYDGAVIRLDDAYAARIREDWPGALEEIDEKRLAEIRGEAEAEAEVDEKAEGDEKAAKKTTAKKTSRAG